MQIHILFLFAQLEPYLSSLGTVVVDNSKDMNQGVETSQVSDFGQCNEHYFDRASRAFCEGVEEPTHIRMG